MNVPNGQLGLNTANDDEEKPDAEDACLPSPGLESERSGTTSSSAGSSSILEKDKLIDNLQMQLLKAETELNIYTEKYLKLKNMQESVDGEIHELTASLFQEAYRIATEAHERRVSAEKLFLEAVGKVDVLQAEVKALKSASAPTSCIGTFKFTPSYNPVKFFKQLSIKEGKRHRRNRSDCDALGADAEPAALVEIDPIVHQEFASWRETFDLSNLQHPFMKRIFQEDVTPCLTFNNEKLSASLTRSILDNTIMLEKICWPEASQSKICSLSQVPRECNYRMKICNAEDWHFISSFCRNRIAAVCDLFTYLRYLSRGLLRHGIYDSYVEVVQLRKHIALSRLGIKCSTDK